MPSSSPSSSSPTTRNVQYSADNSLALNLALAGEINGLKDQEVTDEQYDQITRTSTASVLTDTAFAFSSSLTPPPGFSSDLSLGIGLLSLLGETYSAAKHPHFVAWMPAHLAPTPWDAQNVLGEMMSKAIDDTVAELGWSHKAKTAYISQSKAVYFYNVYVAPEGSSCPSPFAEDGQERCYVSVTIRPPVLKVDTPIILGKDAGESYYFTGYPIASSKFTVVNRKGSQIDSRQFYFALSKRLPEWSYFYNPPKKDFKADSALGSSTLDWPALYHKGQELLFVKRGNK